MADTIEKKLLELGVELPEAAAPVANYVPFAQTGSLIMTSGQLPVKDGKLMAMGLLGRELGVEAGKLAAKWCSVNILAQAKAALGDLERIKRVVKITVFVASTPDFTDHHLVANGASDFLVAALGERGRHVRSAVGVAALPMNAPVEIEAIIEIA
ncbi:RidA family protein [Nitratireductor indicus]|uniref:Endoribonuclease L-PSP n=1 Tax=Nitratireductor indicus C115 TaxID=1231190 RepID=K2NWS7_9HYPH|nr:RidA family protein [Nitratireductor indicus]EKF43765.1 endoribonuclease L-PSP [Nitratireductor indicus C115]MDS1135347.1 RidA family protein [Nitratireductor indicus]SFQ17402.1 Enamine deaminase RidA, house cleaning of reactive enamine intermediates, YjgF/YER057c/UK114 family [Nitratireductor indicus]